MSKTLINRKQLLAKVPYSDRHILNMEKKNAFPKRIVLSTRCVAWVESEIDEWIEQRRASNDTAHTPVKPQKVA